MVDLPNLNQVQCRKTSTRRLEWFARYRRFRTLWKSNNGCGWEKTGEKEHKTLITNRLQETLNLAQNDESSKSLGKHPYWPWQMTFLLLNILSVFLPPACIFVQKGINCDEEMLKNSFRTEVTAWLTFDLSSQIAYAASFCRSCFK